LAGVEQPTVEVLPEFLRVRWRLKAAERESTSGSGGRRIRMEAESFSLVLN